MKKIKTIKVIYNDSNIQRKEVQKVVSQIYNKRSENEGLSYSKR